MKQLKKYFFIFTVFFYIGNALSQANFGELDNTISCFEAAKAIHEQTGSIQTLCPDGTMYILTDGTWVEIDTVNATWEHR